MTRIAASLGREEASRRRWDVVVVGAGPAGALLARETARGGRSTLLVERREFPRPKVCGACLNLKALGVLAEVGLGSLVEHLGGVPLDAFRVHHSGRSLRLGLPGGMALGRDVFDAALVEAAKDAGTAFLPGTIAHVGPPDESTATRPVRLADRRGEAELETTARVVVVATGLAAPGLEADAAPTLRRRIAPGARVGAGCTLTPPGDGLPHAVWEPGTIVMAVGRSGYVGLVGLTDGRINVAAAFDRDAVRDAGGPGPAAVQALREAGMSPLPGLETAAWQGTPALTRQTRPVALPGLFLIGDAAGYVEPFTGEGMGAALLSARLTAPLAIAAVDGWSPALEMAWARQHARRVERPQRYIRGLARLARHPWLTRAALAVAARSPRVSNALIARINTLNLPVEAS